MSRLLRFSSTTTKSSWYPTLIDMVCYYRERWNAGLTVTSLHITVFEGMFGTFLVGRLLRQE